MPWDRDLIRRLTVTSTTKMFAPIYFSCLLTVVQVCACSMAVSQPVDSLEVSIPEEWLDHDSHGLPDSTLIEHRKFDSSKVATVRKDPAMHYTEPKTAAESLWDRFLAWLGQLLDSLFDGALNTNWGRVAVWALGLVMVAVLILMLFRVNAFRVIFGGNRLAGAVGMLEEDIQSMDFERLIGDASEKGNYRLGVRLLFLYALRLLADRNLIQWTQGKTNHDYLEELGASDLKSGFDELNFYFEYAWYGNFHITERQFSTVRSTFDEWRLKVSKQ